MRAGEPLSLSESDRAAMRASVAFARRIPKDIGVPADRAVFGFAMLRRMLTLRGLPKQCRDRKCRRVRFCVGATIRCDRDFPPPEASRDEIAAAVAELHRAIKQRVAEFGEAGGKNKQ